MSDCIFCRIASGNQKADILYEDEECMAFEDIHPQAPVHFLVIPKKHITTNIDADQETLGMLLFRAARVAESKGLDKDGFRTVINCRRHAGQSVDHLHVHVLGGRWFAWPPG